MRTHHADGTDVDDGPPVSTTYPLGYFREDYEFIAHPGQDEFLDVHNGRWCVTPEYPNGTYAYFATVDENWNSAYPYVVGPTFYGEATNRSVTSVNEPTTVYTGATGLNEDAFDQLNWVVFPNADMDLIAVQARGLVAEDLRVDLLDLQGRLVQSSQIEKGSTMTHFDVQTVYAGLYLVRISNENYARTFKVRVDKL